MGFRLTDFGERLMLNRMFDGHNVEIGLFINDVTPTDATVIGDLTEPNVTDDPWYGRQNIGVAEWLPAATDAGVTTKEAAIVLAFVHDLVSRSIDAYGWFAWSPDSPNGLIWAERFTSPPKVMPDPVPQINLHVKVRLKDSND